MFVRIVVILEVYWLANGLKICNETRQLSIHVCTAVLNPIYDVPNTVPRHLVPEWRRNHLNLKQSEPAISEWWLRAAIGKGNVESVYFNVFWSAEEIASSSNSIMAFMVWETSVGSNFQPHSPTVSPLI